MGRCQQLTFNPLTITSKAPIGKELSLVILKLNLVNLLFSREPPKPFPYFWIGYQRASSVYSRVKSKSSYSKAKSKSRHSRAKSKSQYLSAKYGYSTAKSSTLTDTCDHETQVSGREALLTILSIVKKETPPVKFTQEFILLLSLYHSLCNNTCKQFTAAKVEALFASEKALLAKHFGETQWLEGLTAK